MRKRLYLENLRTWVQAGIAEDQDWIDHMALEAERAWVAARMEEYQRSGQVVPFDQWLDEHQLVFQPPTDADCLAMPVSDELKALKIDQIRAAYAAARDQGCVVSGGIRLQCQDIDLDRWVQLTMTMADLDLAEATIRDADNLLHTVTAEQWKQMRTELAVHVQALLQKSWALKDQAAAASTLADLLAIKW